MLTVYSKPNCSNCERVKNYLNENGVDFQTVDLTADKAVLAEMKEKAKEGGFKLMAPIVTVDSEILFTGWDEDALKEAVHG